MQCNWFSTNYVTGIWSCHWHMIMPLAYAHATSMLQSTKHFSSLYKKHIFEMVANFWSETNQSYGKIECNISRVLIGVLHKKWFTFWRGLNSSDHIPSNLGGGMIIKKYRLVESIKHLYGRVIYPHKRNTSYKKNILYINISIQFSVVEILPPWKMEWSRRNSIYFVPILKAFFLTHW